MARKAILAVLIFLFVLVFVGFIRLHDGSSSSKFSGSSVKVVDSANSLDGQVSNSQSSGSGITLSELNKHNSQSDCWISYDGKVYDITTWLPQHPGGINRILPYCGTADEFQKAFTKQHGKSKVNLLMSVGTFMGDFEIKGSLNG